MLIRFIFMVAFVLVITSGTGRTEPSAGISMIGFSIQVGAFTEVRNAERLTAKMQEKGIEAFYFKRENGFYAVRFGDFLQRDDARKAAKKLVSVGFIGSYFIVDHGPGQRLVLKPAGDCGGPVAVVVGRIVGERAVRPVLRLPEVP